jgi:redox-sensitive bicupin YhaK (pirin superfamily)
MKSVEQIIKSEKVNMGGIILDQPLPNNQMDQIDPFLLIHHWDDNLKGDRKQSELGVGPHPHRGFSPVTLIFEGGVHHRDSIGNNSIVMDGGTQWMFAGRGIIHSERPTKELAENGGAFEFIQFWVNVPAKNKMEQPGYVALQKEKTPEYVSEDKNVTVGVVSGEFKNIKGTIDTFTPITTLRFIFNKGGKINFDIPSEHNTLIYVLEGDIIINDKNEIKTRELAWFNNDGSNIDIKAVESTKAILLSGKPIDEEVATYGPIVMNTRSEVMTALTDAQMGKMGVLIEEFD